LGLVVERTGRRADALAALERAVALEPDNWRHQVRLALGSWGESRLRAARAALKRCPHLPLAHWLAATVFGFWRTSSRKRAARCLRLHSKSPARSAIRTAPPVATIRA
jgi:hypothetical protein